MTNYYLIRHGFTDWIEQDILHGISDRPLSEFGQEQARATADYMRGKKVDRLYTSPLIRCKQTADVLSAALGVQPIEVEDLKEENYGILEGRRDWWGVVKKHPKIIPIYTVIRTTISTLTGEPVWQFKRRVVAVWEGIKSENPSGSVAVVGHSGVLRNILLHEFGGKRSSISLTTSSVTQFEVEVDGTARMIKLNHNDHLPGDQFL
jgi:broad specificity phosphatase PhoE